VTSGTNCELFGFSEWLELLEPFGIAAETPTAPPRQHRGDASESSQSITSVTGK